ncbi:MAG: SAM-dependent methyltransferase, partial [Candidatus Latescibacterota bacterium]
MDYRDLLAGKSAEGFWFRAKRDLVERLVRRALANLPEEAPRVLNVGCGTGSDLAVLSRHGRVWAVDCDHRALALVD